MFKKSSIKILVVFFISLSCTLQGFSQINEDSSHSRLNLDTLPKIKEDTLLRIKNFSPYFTLHVDSTLDYQFDINKNKHHYYYYLKNSPVGLKINKDNGLLHFKAEKSFFLSGKLKYDHEYKVNLGVQNLENPQDKIDTNFVLLFYNTDIIPSRLKPTVASTVMADEGDTINFKLQCEEGSFPIESITYFSNNSILSLTPISHCGDDFTWIVPYDFIKENENVKQKKLVLTFVGADKFFNRDTSVVTFIISQTINYPQRILEYRKTVTNINEYVLQLKSTFRTLDQRIKRTKNTRTTFDLTSASTALGGTIFSSLPGDQGKTTGKILPSVGVALVPVKEAVAPNKSYEQNSASLVRNSIKRLQYLLSDNVLVGDKDPDIVKKTTKLKDELKQIQLQLIDVPIVEESIDVKELDEYFNNPKVNKKYRVKE